MEVLKRKMVVTAMAIAVALVVPGMANAAKALPRYSAKTIGDIVQLHDNKADMTVSVLIGTSNAYEIVVHGKNAISMNTPSTTALRNSPGLNGIPFLAPFAIRLDEMGFYANGKKYSFDPGMGNIRPPIPTHGLLTGTHEWKLVTAKADANSATVVNKLDFYRYPDWMKQFPFAQTYTMTYRLKDGSLEVNLKIDNLSNQPLPVSVGYHPYFSLPETDRNHWSLEFSANTHWIAATPGPLPTGEKEPSDTFFGMDHHDMPLSRLADKRFDDVFSDLERDAQGRANFTIKGDTTSLTVSLGPKMKAFYIYSEVLGGAVRTGPPAAAPGTGPARPPVAPVAYDGPVVPLTAPNDVPRNTRGFVALEPLAAVTDDMNLVQKGQYNELQYIAPGDSWNESIWITPHGF